MKSNLTLKLTERFWAYLMSAMLLVAISACGGGNGSPGAPLSGGGGGGGGSTTVNGVITLKLTNSEGVATNTIPAGGSLFATARVVDPNGNPVVNALVTFSLSGTEGSLAIPRVLTDSLGNAVAVLQAGTTVGAATLTATTTVIQSTTISTTANFQSVASGFI